MPRRLNARLFFCTLAGIAVLVLVLHFVHSQQMHRNVGGMLHQAERALEQKEYGKAADLLQRYLDYEPDDTEAMVRYATALEQGAGAAQSRFKVFLLLEQVLRRQPDRIEARQHAVQAAIDVGRNQDAIRHLQYLLAAGPQTPELEHQLGWCQEAVGLYEDSAKSFERAIALAPQQVESYILLAELLARHLKQPEEAAKVMDAMTTANAKSWQAHLARARFHHSQGHLDSAAADVYLAAELAPQRDEVLLAAAEMALFQGNLADAQSRVNRALELHPKSEQLYRDLATLLASWGNFDDAIDCLLRGLAQLPDSAGLHIHLAELYLDNRRAEQARQMCSWVKENASSPGVASYLEGRLLMLDGQWPLAIDKLSSARTALGATSEWASNLCAYLGQCYERLGELDKQQAAFRDAVVLNPGNLAARLQLCQALLALRFPEEACRELRYLSDMPHVPPQTWTLLAQALLDRFQRRPPTAAEWKELDPVLEKAASLQSDDPALANLQADRMFLQGNGTQAQAILNEALEKRPDSLRLWLALATMQAKLNDDLAALATLQKAQEKFGNRLEMCRAFVSYWSARPGPQARTALAQVSTQVAALPTFDQVLVLRELAEASLLAGDKRLAESTLERLSALLPKDLQSRVKHFDLILKDNRDAQAVELIGEIRKIEGEDGVLWRACDASRGIWKARRGDHSQLEIVRQRLAEIQKRRIDWGRVALLEGNLEEINGNLRQALECYRRAIELGDRPPAVVLRVAQWLADENRFPEASQVLRQLEDQMPLPRDHAKLATTVALQIDEFKRALTLAHQAVPGTSRDYREKLWLAHIQWLGGQPLEAQATLREAVQIAPRVPQVWVALVKHLNRTKLSKHLEDTLLEMEDKIPADRADLTMALCLEATGRTEEAEAIIAAISRRVLVKSLAHGNDDGDDLATVGQIAEFYLRQDQPAKAEPFLRILLSPSTMTPPELSQWARRQLAFVLAYQGQPNGLQEAVNLLATLGPATGKAPPVEDERVRAFVLSKQSGRQAEAVRLFEESVIKQPLTADEQFLLAQVYDANQDDSKASRQMRALLVIHRDQPRYLAYYTRYLLNRGEAEAALFYLTALELVEPTSPRTLQLRSDFQKSRAGG